MTVATLAGQAPRLDASRPWFGMNFTRFLTLLAAHALLGILLPAQSFIATAFAWIVVGLGLSISWRRPTAGPYCALYIVGAELLWRMSEANIFWETGKYATALVLVFSLRKRFKITPITIGAITYFLLLLPACAITIGSLAPELARTRIAFNLSGPFLLATGIVAFSVIPLEQVRPQRMLAWLTLPIVAVAARVGWATLNAGDIVFESEASYATSGGYGPNQVSTILGVGALGLVLLASQSPRRLHQVVLYALAGALFFEGVLTFSRGGVGAFVLGAAALFLHMSTTPRRARGYLLGALALGLVLFLFVLPRADEWTGGLLGDRFTSFDSSGRAEIAQQDLALFVEHPIMGVGVGLAPALRPVSHFGAASHTEFTRALSEHGAFGALSLALLLVLIVATYLRAPTVGSKAWTAALVAWGIGTLTTASFRLAASAAVISLAFIDFARLKESDVTEEQ